MTARPPSSPSAQATAMDCQSMLVMPMTHFTRPLEPSEFLPPMMTNANANRFNLAAPATKKALLANSPVSSFDAFSQYFHLPLKIAAEQFGVRATAFKKRCRSIGIRHWPYRKVRSLKRSLQELCRCQEQGVLNDKQQYQLVTFQAQLDIIMAPETYDIDPSGRLPEPAAFNRVARCNAAMPLAPHDDDDESGDDDSYASASTQSPRYGATFVDCSISPTDEKTTFGDNPAPTHMRFIRTAHAGYYPPMMKPNMNEMAGGPMRSGKETMQHAPYKMPFNGYEHYNAVRTPRGTQYGELSPTSMSTNMHDVKQELYPSKSYAPTERGKHDELRATEEASFPSNLPPSHVDNTSERFFDDVLLQISPDFGCFV